MATADDINRLVHLPPPEKRLDGAATPQAIRAKTGLERKLRGQSAVDSYEMTTVSTDGLFTLTVRVVTT